MKRVVFAGSFDPITKGHEWVIQEASKLFDEVWILVASNSEKKSYFTLQERKNLILKCCAKLPNIKVETLPKDYVVEFCVKNNISYQVRGIRNGADLEYEKTVLQVNRQINLKVETIFLIPPENLSHLSSSLVKGLVGFKNWKSVVEKTVSPCVVSAFLYKVYSSKLSHFWLGKDQLDLEDLSVRLDEPQRYYHSAQHILELINAVTHLRKSSEISEYESEVLTWASFFHDAIYNPQKNDNEEKSKELWESFCERAKIEESIKLKVSEIIMATKNHTQIKPGDRLIDLFLDLDLAILGSDPDRFDEYDDQIAKEYSFYPPEDYAKGRRMVLEKFFKESKLFRTKEFNHLEQKAKDNLKRKI